MSKTNTSILISMLKDLRNPTASTWCLCGTAVFGKKTHFQKCT